MNRNENYHIAEVQQSDKGYHFEHIELNTSIFRNTDAVYRSWYQDSIDKVSSTMKSSLGKLKEYQQIQGVNYIMGILNRRMGRRMASLEEQGIKGSAALNQAMLGLKDDFSNQADSYVQGAITETKRKPNNSEGQQPIFGQVLVDRKKNGSPTEQVD